MPVPPPWQGKAGGQALKCQLNTSIAGGSRALSQCAEQGIAFFVADVPPAIRRLLTRPESDRTSGASPVRIIPSLKANNDARQSSGPGEQPGGPGAVARRPEQQRRRHRGEREDSRVQFALAAAEPAEAEPREAFARTIRRSSRNQVEGASLSPGPRQCSIDPVRRSPWGSAGR
jgi:hypothetical protein